MPQHGIGNFVWASDSRREKVNNSREKFSGGEGVAKND